MNISASLMRIIYIWKDSDIKSFKVSLTLLSSRSKMRTKAIKKTTVRWEVSPGGNWSQTGTVMSSQRSRTLATTCPLSEAPTSTFCWSQQVSPGVLNWTWGFCWVSFPGGYCWWGRWQNSLCGITPPCLFCQILHWVSVALLWFSALIRLKLERLWRKLSIALTVRELHGTNLLVFANFSLSGHWSSVGTLFPIWKWFGAQPY